MMDMFMDKLAQKLTAQEIIRANSAADAQEMTKLKNRVAEYNECLDRLQQLITEGSEKVEGAQMSSDELKNLVQDSIVMIEDVKLLVQDSSAMSEDMRLKIEEQLDGDLATVNENVHKECVKVYRNVQAVVTEESTKQSQALAETDAKVTAAKKRTGAILGISIAALIMSLCSVVLQVLQMLNFKFF